MNEFTEDELREIILKFEVLPLDYIYAGIIEKAENKLAVIRINNRYFNGGE